METRFEFGKNWRQFLTILDEDHIAEAQDNLQAFLGSDFLQGKSFLDIGSGSGIHSLAARRMGARVHSFDYDEEAVKCTQELRDRYSPDDPLWTVESGSVLDRQYMESLGYFDVCYAWGVLHHTGGLRQALYNAQVVLQPGGILFIGIYNDQGLISVFWKIIKRGYNSSSLGKWLLTPVFFTIFFLAGLFMDLVRLRNPSERYRRHKKYRGMSLIHDWKDWLGGYPYEPAAPQQIIRFFENLNFELIRFEPTGHGFGNNQFVFRRKKMD